MGPAGGGILLEDLCYLLVVAEEDGRQRPRVKSEDVPILLPVPVQLLNWRPAEAVEVADEGEAEGEIRYINVGTVPVAQEIKQGSDQGISIYYTTQVASTRIKHGGEIVKWLK